MPTPNRITMPWTICIPVSFVPSQYHSISAANGGARQRVNNIVKPGPSSGNAWNKATSPTPMPIAPLIKSRGKGEPKTFVLKMEAQMTAQSKRRIVAQTSRQKFADEPPMILAERWPQITEIEKNMVVRNDASIGAGSYSIAVNGGRRTGRREHPHLNARKIRISQVGFYRLSPHPSPLPWGEGGTFAASSDLSATAFSRRASRNQKAATFLAFSLREKVGMRGNVTANNPRRR